MQYILIKDLPPPNSKIDIHLDMDIFGHKALTDFPLGVGVVEEARVLSLVVALDGQQTIFYCHGMLEIILITQGNTGCSLNIVFFRRF